MSKAETILNNAAQHLTAKANQYDKAGERSIPAVVKVFNVLTGHKLTATQGWLFMTILKMVRTQQGSYCKDSFEDGAAYFALMGEEAEELATPIQGNASTSSNGSKFRGKG